MNASRFAMIASLLSAATLLADMPLAPGESLGEPFADKADARCADDPANTGGRMETDGEAWRFTDTSEGRTGNGGSRFEIRYGADSAIVAAINEVLARPVDGESEDFVAMGRLRRASASSQLVDVSLSAHWDGRDRPRDPFTRRPLLMRLSPDYVEGRDISIGESLPRARFRVWPSGGSAKIESLCFDIGVRIDTAATPETVEVTDFAVAPIAKGDGVSDVATKRVILCTEGMPPAAFIGAWRELGIHARVGIEPAEGEEVAAVYANSLNMPESEAEKIAGYAAKGASIFLAAAQLTGEPAKPLRAVLPVNDWPFRTSLRRTACEAAMDGIDGAIPFSYRFDVHLPGAPIESPLYNYEPEVYLRSRETNPRTSVAMRLVNDSTLPLLVDADVDAAHVVFLGASFEDALALSSPRYADWARKVAKLPFGEKLRDDTISPTMPYDWLMAKARAPYAIEIEEDESTIGELADSPGPREGVDGIYSYRYVYRPGTAPHLTLRLRNHYANIAPLAKAQDLEWPENPTTPGLNDGATTHASVRQAKAIHAVWTGRSAETQRLALRWDKQVRLAGMRVVSGGSHRFWDRNNPRDFSLVDARDGGAEIVSAIGAEYAMRGTVNEIATWERGFDSTRPLDAVELRVTGLDPNAKREPNRGFDSNCHIAELELFGWAGEAGGDISDATLIICTGDLLHDRGTRRTIKVGEIPALSERLIEVTLDALDGFGPVRYEIILMDGDRVLASRDFDVFFIPADGEKLGITGLGWPQPGLLCSPGWRTTNPFGLGMGNWVQGWGGPHDKLWAYSQDLMEIGSRGRDNPARMFSSCTGASHYTNPWRRFLNGEYTWEWVAENYLERIEAGDSRFPRDLKGMFFGLSDRWNGPNVATCFGWDVFVDFDHWLRAQGKDGLQAKSRRGIEAEIREKHGDTWQYFVMRQYADEMLAMQKLYADHGYGYLVWTHGSYPLVGGQLGADLAEMHHGVGTDLFWDLQRQDLWWSIGSRIGIVAANPNLRSGIYDEWGWVNTEQNRWWYGSNGNDDVARRQWYATYFLGRVDLDGDFKPYHHNGFTSQGYHGARYTARDHEIRCRVSNLCAQLRPDEACGFGIVVSWRGQERRMGPKMGKLGFGLYVQNGEDDVLDLCCDVYTPLAKQGLPIAFVTSTDALKNWKGDAPLLLVDAYNWEDWELDAAEDARKRGATIVAIGSRHPRLANPRAEEMFGADAEGVDGAGAIVAYRDAPRTLDAITASALKARIDHFTGEPFEVDPGIAVTPFVSHGTLFFAVCREGDEGGDVDIAIKPGFFHKASASARYAVSLDGEEVMAMRGVDGNLHVALQVPPSSGRVLMVYDPEVAK